MRAAETSRSLRAEVDGVVVHLGRRKLAAEAGLSLPDELEQAAATLEGQGRTAVFAGWDGAVRGVISVADTLKEDAASATAVLPPVPAVPTNGAAPARTAPPTLPEPEPEAPAAADPRTGGISSSGNPSPVGVPVSFVATVAAAGPRTPTGTVHFTDDTIELGTAVLDSEGRGHLTVTGLTVGDHHVAAAHDGDDQCAPSRATMRQVVKPAASTISLTMMPAEPAVGDAGPQLGCGHRDGGTSGHHHRHRRRPAG